ncbi:MAG TPA: vWA domain-containing protein [Gemmatimonadaceae bacterium]|nr:vWA domain-containing protein [Gemmatimonadaceae bacterium]
MKLALAIIAFALTANGCDSAVGSESTNPGHSYIVGIDISGSRTRSELDESKQLLNGLIEKLEPGDKLTLIEVYQGGREPARQWSDSIRTPRNPKQLTGSDRRRLDDFRNIARMQTSILFDSVRAKQIQATDIFGTLTRAADYAKASRNRPTTLLLLSDMINETPDVRMTSMQEIPGRTWIRERVDAKRIPQLRGVCVVVAGADVSSARGAAIRDFWDKYFAAAGTTVSSDNYRNMISDPSEVNCN